MIDQATCERLLRAAGPAVESGPPRLVDSGTFSELLSVLRRRNGFTAFDSAMWVRGSGESRYSIESWNDPAGWRAAYGEMAEGLLFFAEDIFGFQFALGQGRVWLFDPETGNREPEAASVQGWFEAVLTDPESMFGAAVSRAWQRLNGPLKLGERLVPSIPFVLGGTGEVDTLARMQAESGMVFRAELARQIRDLPEGAQVRYGAGE